MRRLNHNGKKPARQRSSIGLTRRRFPGIGKIAIRAWTEKEDGSPTGTALVRFPWSGQVNPVDHIRLYSVALDGNAAAEAMWRSTLSAEERARADRFRRANDRHAFTAAHALTRLALGRYLGVSPLGLNFAAMPGGKPVLPLPAPAPDFSLSHTDGHVAVAVARGAVGVDVESIRRPRLDAALAETAFGAAKAAALGPDPTSESWRTAFFTAWTACEAVLKAEGVGLAVAMERVEIKVNTACLNGRRWHLWHCPLPPSHLLALAWEQDGVPDHSRLDPLALADWCRQAGGDK